MDFVSSVREKKNVIVTGGAGFIGSFLCEKLLSGGARVICIDNFSTSQESNIDHLLREEDFEFIKHDMNVAFDPETYEDANLKRFRIPFEGIQEIYHLACPTSPKKFEEFRMQTLLSNSIGCKNVLDLAVKYRAKVLLGSASVVYGPRPADGHDVKEDDIGCVNNLTPRACYDEGKRYAETMFVTYRQVHQVQAKIARIFRTYGPRMSLYDGQMVPDFVMSALEGKDLIVYGDQTFRTSLTYVTDIVDGLIKLMHATEDLGPVNLGSDGDYPILDIAQKVIEMTASTSHVVYEAPLLFMTSQAIPNISKARDQLGWLPLVTLEDGLRRTIEYAMAQKSLLGFRSGVFSSKEQKS